MIDESVLHDKIIDILDTDLERREDFLDKVKQLAQEVNNEGELYQKIIFMLSHLDLTPEDSIKHWQKILENKDRLTDLMGRPVAFRVAFLDYFLRDKGLISSPMVVEMSIYESARYNVMVDELTGLYNHRFLREFLWKETKRSLRYDKIFSLVMMDIDDLKIINDNYGHLAGDEVIKTIAKLLESNTRIEDIASRFGGDEFILILPETDKEGALSFCNRIKRLIEAEHIEFGNFSFTTRVSLGICTFGEDDKDPVILMEMADRALYRAKYMGKNRIVPYSQEKFES